MPEQQINSSSYNDDPPHYQNARGLIEPEMYVAWDNGLKAFIEQYDLKSSWDESMKNSYHESFRNHVDELLAQIPAKKE